MYTKEIDDNTKKNKFGQGEILSVNQDEFLLARGYDPSDESDYDPDSDQQAWEDEDEDLEDEDDDEGDEDY